MGFRDNALGVGIGFKNGLGDDGGISNPSGDPLLPNMAARHFYYDKLVVANGGVQDFHTYYGVTLNQFKIAINDVFSALDLAGLTSKIKRWTPRIGSIGATQRLNAISTSTTYDGTFSGGVTFSTAGAIFNGTTGYENTNFNQNDFIGLNDSGCSFKLVANTFSGNNTIIGIQDNTYRTNLWIRYESTPNRVVNYWGSNSATSIDNTTLENKFYSYNNRDSGNVTTYKDGVLINSTAFPFSYGVSSEKIFIAALNYWNSSTINFAPCTLRNEVFHDKLIASEVLDLYNILTDFDTALGR